MDATTCYREFCLGVHVQVLLREIRNASGSNEAVYLRCSNWDERPSSDIVGGHPLGDKEVARRRSIYDINDIPVPRRSVAQLLLKEVRMAFS